MTGKSRILSAIAAAAILFGSLAGCAAAPGSDDASSDGDTLKLKVAYFPSAVTNQFARAAAANLQPDGLEVEYVPTGSVGPAQGLVSGAWDIATWGEVGAASTYVNGGTDIRVIASSGDNGAAHEILVRGDSTAQTIADLKGGTGVFDRSTNAYAQFLATIAQYGLEESDYTILENVPDDASALASGQVDFIISIEALASDLIERDGFRELSNGEGLINNYYPVVTTSEILADADKHEAIELYLVALKDYLAWADENPEEEATSIADFFGVSESAALNGSEKLSNVFIPIDDTYIAKEQDLINFFVEHGAFDSYPTGIEEIYDGEFNDVLTD